MSNDWKTAIRNMRLRMEKESQLKLAKEFKQKLFGVNPIDIPVGEFITDEKLEKAMEEKEKMDNKELEWIRNQNEDQNRILRIKMLESQLKDLDPFAGKHEEVLNKIRAEKESLERSLIEKMDFNQKYSYAAGEDLDKIFPDMFGSKTKETSKSIHNGMSRPSKIAEEVQDVFDNHPVYVRIKEQIGKGLVKYGVPVTPEHYSVFGWFEHIQQEETDKIVYNEIMLMKLQEVIRVLNLATRVKDPNHMRNHVIDALSILLDHKEGNE